MFVLDVINALNRQKVKYAIVGGYAVALHGAVRGTVDLDLVISLDEDSMLAAEKAMLSIGLVSRLPVTARDVFHYREEYITNRNMAAWTFYKPDSPLDVVDILITNAVDDIEVDEIKALGSKLNVASIGSLIALKKQSGREQDIEDIAALTKLQKMQLK